MAIAVFHEFACNFQLWFSYSRMKRLKFISICTRTLVINVYVNKLYQLQFIYCLLSSRLNLNSV